MPKSVPASGDCRLGPANLDAEPVVGCRKLVHSEIHVVEIADAWASEVHDRSRCIGANRQVRDAVAPALGEVGPDAVGAGHVSGKA